MRRATVEHPFGTIKSWMGATHFQMKTLPRVSTEMSLHVLAYNMKRAIIWWEQEKYWRRSDHKPFVSKKSQRKRRIPETYR